MSNYLLLRNNQETGPYSLQDLLQFGLKAYDLVWVQGKSAAWRYPSEIDELKPYSPGIEEQPYDRFYKKKTAEETPPVVTLKTAEQYTYQPVVQQQEAIKHTYTAKKSVFVTLPQQKSANKTIPEKEPVMRQSVTTGISKESVATTAEVKYSQPLDEIKEMYVKTLYDRKGRIARKTFLLSSLKKAAVVAALIAVGMLVGFILRPKSANEKTVAQQQPVTETTTATNIPDEKTEEELPQVPVEQQQQIMKKISEEPEKILNAPKNKGEALTSSTPKKEIEKPVLKEMLETKASYSPTEVNAATGERNKTVRNTTPAENEKTTGKIEKQTSSTTGRVSADEVSVISNDYKKVPFGGIRNLQLTVTNHGNTELDNVIVELQYLKPNEQPLRTENIRFTSIAANESSTVRIPDTNRGIKVSYKIISIKKQHADGVAER